MTTGVAGGGGAGAALVSFLGGGGDCLAGASSLSGVVVRRSLTLPKNDFCASVTVTSSA